MNNELSEERINKDCPHCDPKSFALTNKLEETERFWIVCDVHLLTEGHILIVPKKHISCMGNYPNEYYKEFLEHHKKISSFILKTYGSLAVFEHGKIGQTVYHSHVHYFPYIGNEYKIIPEGEKYLIPIDSLDDLKGQLVDIYEIYNRKSDEDVKAVFNKITIFLFISKSAQLIMNFK